MPELKPYKFFTVSKFVLLGSTIFTTKLVLLVVAYFFNETEYNTFNQVYFTASLLILFGSLGFGFAIVKISVAAIKIAAAVFINIVLAITAIQLLSVPVENIFHVISIFIYSFFGSLGGVLLFRLLFNGDYKRYTLLMFLYAFFHLLLIPAVVLFNADIITCFPFTTGLWFLLSYKFIPAYKENPAGSFAELYKLGFSAFIINTAVPLALVIDKFFVNNYYTMEVANAYTFAWGLTAPLFYIGTLVEKMIYSASETEGEHIIRKSFRLLGSLVILYTAAVFAVVYFIPFLLPKSVDISLLKNIFTFMSGGFALYVFLHFPINGFLFKFSAVAVQKKVAAAFTIITVLMLSFFAYLMAANNVPGYKVLLIATWGFIFSMLAVKSVVVFGKAQSA